MCAAIGHSLEFGVLVPVESGSVQNLRPKCVCVCVCVCVVGGGGGGGGSTPL